MTSPFTSPRARGPVLLVTGLLAVSMAAAGCSRGSETGASSAADDGESSGNDSAVEGVTGDCAEALDEAKTAVAAATEASPEWAGPTTGPKAQPGKSVIYVAADLTNPGVAAVGDGVKEAAATIGWKSRTIDGQGSPSGQQSAFSQALTLNPDGIVIGGFDPLTTQKQLDDANSAGIPVLGWHAVGSPGPSDSPELFNNITTKVEDVAKISAQWIIADSEGAAGVVIFTDASIPFAKGKSDTIEADLGECSTVEVLTTENIPIPDAASRTPQAVSTLLGEFDKKWTHSVAINDLYYDNAAPALRAAGRQGDGAPYNVGAGDGSAAAFDRIRSGQFQAATVPEPLNEQGWQIIDEMNRAVAGEPATDYYAPVHVTDSTNAEDGDLYDPANGYQDVYKKIWGK